MNNQVTVSGEIKSIKFSHELYGEKFYLMNLCIERLSGSTDNVPVMISDRGMEISADHIGKRVKVIGQFRSYNRVENEKKKLILFVFAEEVSFEECDQLMNEISIWGYICKKPTFRQTPLGRQISDVLIAVNRDYGKSDYIPCVVWGRNAKFAARKNVGEFIHICGRIQSREYIKDGITHEAYEVSTQTLNEE